MTTVRIAHAEPHSPTQRWSPVAKQYPGELKERMVSPVIGHRAFRGADRRHPQAEANILSA
jgi:hypothetical protein